jgi:hypothetical protein
MKVDPSFKKMTQCLVIKSLFIIWSFNYSEANNGTPSISPELPMDLQFNTDEVTQYFPMFISNRLVSPYESLPVYSEFQS